MNNSYGTKSIENGNINQNKQSLKMHLKIISKLNCFNLGEISEAEMKRIFCHPMNDYPKPCHKCSR